MQYLLMIYEAEEIWENKSDDEKRAEMEKHDLLHEALDRDGVEWSGQPLMATTTAVSVRSRAGQVTVSDGPFAETKEALAGFYLIDVDSLEHATHFAAMIPSVQTGTIEVRPIADHSGLT